MRNWRASVVVILTMVAAAACADREVEPEEPPTGREARAIACGGWWDCVDGNPCTADQCVGGSCSNPPSNEGGACSDGNPCTIGTTCMAGTCGGGSKVADGTSCSDGDPCTEGTTCQAGVCTSPTSVDVCTDPNPDDCTGVACSVFGPGCTTFTLPGGSACSDGNPCTASDSCNWSGTCLSGMTYSCPDPNPSDCAVPACDGSGGCVSGPAPDGAPCDDANGCTSGTSCSAGVCGGGATTVCPDPTPTDCTVPVCDPGTGACTASNAPNGTPCVDADPCTSATVCAAGACGGGTTTTCPDPNPSDCAVPACDGAGGCVNGPAPNGSACDDGDPCTVGTTCAGGACGGGVVTTCSDPNPSDCVVPACNGAGGCVDAPAPAGTSCSDGSACTFGELCDGAGACAGGMPVVCNDGDPCTVDGCAPATGCTFTPIAGCGVPDAGVPTPGAPDAAVGGADAAPGSADAAPGAADAAPGAADAAPGAADAAPGVADAAPGAADAAPGTADAAAGDADAGVAVGDASSGEPDAGEPWIQVRGGGCECRAGAAGRAGSSAGDAGVLLGVLAVVAGLAGRARRRRRAVVTAVLVAIGASASPAAGQARQALDVHLWHPSGGGAPYLGAEGGAILGAGEWAGGLFVGYASKPLVARAISGGETREITLVDKSVLFDLVFAYGVADRVQVTANVPLVSAQHGDPLDDRDPVASGGLGDVRLDGKVRLVGAIAATQGLAVAAVLGLSAPTGTEEGFASSGAWAFRPRVVAETIGGGAGLAASAGFILRSHETRFEDLTVGNELEMSLAGRMRLGATSAHGVGELHFRLGFADPGRAQMPVEALVGVAWSAVPGLDVMLGYGAGLTEGYGAPEARFVLGVRYTSTPQDGDDWDGDGIRGAVDECPRMAGTAENNGCPDYDSDADAVLDRLDRCPSLPGPSELDGCPGDDATRDSDGDGLADRADRCPRSAGPPESDGCPDSDTDGDGVVDRLDRCPSEPGAREAEGCPDRDRDGDLIVDRLDACPDAAGPTQTNGCPDPDGDGDGLADRVDRCPTEPETMNGVEDDDGCPDKGQVLVVVTADEIVIKEQVHFDVGKATIHKRSYKLLATVAKALFLHPEIRKIRIEGHTDDRGPRANNLELSQARADAVMKHLIEVNGVEPERLEAVGYGPDQPVAENRTNAGRALNRRVQFRILERR